MKYLIVGLGNIGDGYTDTRHNIGFTVLDALAKASNTSFNDKRYGSICSVKYKGREFILLKPSTFMNLSGNAVRYWMKKEKIDPGNILVIVDDISLPLGAFRLRKKGSDGGHNGLISIIETLGSNEFPRLRIGIGSDFAKGYQVDYVLSKWTKQEEAILIPRIAAAIEMIKDFTVLGADITMNIHNKKSSEYEHGNASR